MDWADECANALEQAFEFLVTDYGYTILRRESSNEGFSLHLRSERRHVSLLYDFIEDHLHLEIFRIPPVEFKTITIGEENTCYFWTLFQHYDPGLDKSLLQPTDRQCLGAIALNAALLRRYGDRILKGEEWIGLPSVRQGSE